MVQRLSQQLRYVWCKTVYHCDNSQLFFKEMIKRTFRLVSHMPNHIFYDNNCSMKRHVKDDPDFANVGLLVDVFHFKCKHSECNTFCQENGNLALFPELLHEDG